MFCKTCGAQIDDKAVVCLNCGAQVTPAAYTAPPSAPSPAFCKNCGAAVNPGAAVCVQCGAPVASGYQPAGEQKSKMVAGLLQIFIGGLGIGRFYLGYTGIGIAQIAVTVCTCGVGAIWTLIDGIMILTGSVKTDANGVPLKD